MFVVQNESGTRIKNRFHLNESLFRNHQCIDVSLLQNDFLLWTALGARYLKEFSLYSDFWGSFFNEFQIAIAYFEESTVIYAKIIPEETVWSGSLCFVHRYRDQRMRWVKRLIWEGIWWERKIKNVVRRYSLHGHR